MQYFAPIIHKIKQQLLSNIVAFFVLRCNERQLWLQLIKGNCAIVCTRKITNRIQVFIYQNTSLIGLITLRLQNFCNIMTQSEIKIRAEHFSAYGYHGKTIQDINRSTSNTRNQIYELTLNGLGKVMTIRDKYELIMGSPWIFISKSEAKDETFQNKATADIHPFFVYLIKTLLNYDAISLLKVTDYDPTVLHEFKKRSGDEEGCPTIKISQLFDTERRCEVEKKLTSINSRLQRLSWFHKQMQKDQQNCLIQYKQWLKRGYREPIVARLSANNEYDAEMLEIVGQKLFQQVKALQPLKESYQAIKLKMFEKNHKQYYRTSFLTKNEKQSQFLNSICVKKPSRQPSLLHNLEEHVRLREVTSQTKEFKAYCIQLIKSLVEELKHYTNEVSTEYIKYFYEFLQPKNVFIDQMSMKPKLSFNPLLLDALGLRNKPLSIEQMLSFFPTPQAFNYFEISAHMESSANINFENQLIIKDSFYGCIQMFGDQINKLNAKQITNILQIDKTRLQQTKQKILVWRIMLTCYFLIHGKQFGSQTNGNTIKNLQSFKKQINDSSQKLKRNITNLDFFLTGSQIKNQNPKYQAEQQTKQFNFTFEQIYNYLGLNLNSDQILQDMKYKKIKRYYDLRKLLLRNILRIFMTDLLLMRLYNVKKYMIIYCVIAEEVVEEAYQIFSAQQKLPGERRKLTDSFEKQIIRLKGQKPYTVTLKSTFNKILKYREKRDQTDQQAKYINKDPEGLRMFNYILQIRHFVNNLATRNEYLNKMESAFKEQDQIKNEAEEVRNNQDKKNYNLELDKVYKQLSSNIQTIRSLCYEVTTTCFKAKLPESLHKYDKSCEESKESHKIYSIELENTLKTFLCLQPDNLLNYETLIVPYLNLDEKQRQPQVRIIEQQSERQSRLKIFELIKQLLSPDVMRLSTIAKDLKIVPFDKPGQNYFPQSEVQKLEKGGQTKVYKQYLKIKRKDRLSEIKQQYSSSQQL